MYGLIYEMATAISQHQQLGAHYFGHWVLSLAQIHNGVSWSNLTECTKKNSASVLGDSLRRESVLARREGNCMSFEPSDRAIDG